MNNPSDSTHQDRADVATSNQSNPTAAGSHVPAQLAEVPLPDAALATIGKLAEFVANLGAEEEKKVVQYLLFLARAYSISNRPRPTLDKGEPQIQHIADPTKLGATDPTTTTIKP